MLESQVQSKLIKKLESDGWYVVKLIRTNKNGIPDLVCFKGGEFKFVEVKREGGVLSPLQKYRIKELTDKNFNVEVVYG